MFKNIRYVLLASPLMLAACGEGYEMMLTDTYFPYGNQRTAGSGVAYVLAKMMPQKELKLQPVKPRPAPQPQAQLQETKQIMSEIPDDPPAKQADDIFIKEQAK